MTIKCKSTPKRVNCGTKSVHSPSTQMVNQFRESYSDAIVGEYENMEIEGNGSSARRTAMLKLGARCLLGILFVTFSITTIVLLSKNNTTTKQIYSELSDFIGNQGTEPPTQSPPTDLCAVAVKDEDRYDCHADLNASPESCVERGCCWNDKNRTSTKVPSCYFATAYQGYSVQNIEQASGDRTVVTLVRRVASGYPLDIATVRVEVTELDNSKIRVKIDDPTSIRWEVPLPPLNNQPARVKDSKLYSVEVANDGVLKISRLSTKTVIFHTDLKQLIFSDQFLQLSTKVPGTHLYGLGEHKDDFRKELDWRTYTMLNSDRAPTENLPAYGTHPFYLMVEDDQANSHGVLLFNNNIMDVVLQPSAITFRPIGGVLDFYIYLGPTPASVISQHIELIGRPQMPPMWGLGFHLCKYGYFTLNNTRDTWQRTRDAGIPFDVQWNDIDYMTEFDDFTYDKVNFAGLPEFVKEIHDAGMKWVPIIDPAVSGSEAPGSYPPYDEGVKMDIFVKDVNDKIYSGKVWNTKSSVFPDFTNPATTVYWAKQFQDFYREVPFDGAWIDMNEPANSYNGLPDGCPSSSLDNPPYVPGAINALATKTLCMTAKHHVSTHYNLHNMYAIYEAKATQEAMIAIRGPRRPFIISRASSTGIGRYGSHWTGDVYSSWDNLKYSIPTNLNFNMFGVPLVGTDICGFTSNTTVELCARWHELGAFYGFARNHNTIHANDQDPVALGSTVVAAAKRSLNMRYAMLPYLYTLFYRASAFGETVMRPLFFEYPLDKNVYPLEEQFMWGPSVLISPVLEAGKVDVDAYFPAGRWYDFETQQLIIDSKGESKTLDIELEKISVAVRGGRVVPTQAPKVTTVAQKSEPFDLLVALDGDGKAQGELFWDDGDNLFSTLLMNYSWLKFDVKDNKLTSTPVVNNYKDDFVAGSVTILGLTSAPKNATVNGAIAKFTFDGNVTRIEVSQPLADPLNVEWMF